MPLTSRVPLWPSATTLTITVHLDAFQITEEVWVTVTDRTDGSEMVCEQLPPVGALAAESEALWSTIRRAATEVYMVEA